MSSHKVYSQEASIVIVGSFNPAIFHPEWFVRHDLVPADDLKGVKVEIIHPDLSKFSFTWMSIDVLREKFISRTNDPARFNALKDLVISTFYILEHTVLNQLGLNLKIEYEIDDEENWHKIGDVLAPKEIWQDSLPDRIGLKRLLIESPRPDNLDGYIRVSIGPSISTIHSVKLEVNNHFELLDRNSKPQHKATEIIAQKWDEAMELAGNICKSTIKRAIEYE